MYCCTRASPWGDWRLFLLHFNDYMCIPIDGIDFFFASMGALLLV